MKYSEELLWILDKPGTTLHNQDEAFQENIAFVHSLGLKCDCVGWCKMDLSILGHQRSLAGYPHSVKKMDGKQDVCIHENM